MSNFPQRNGSSGGVVSAILTVVFVLAIAAGGWFVTHRGAALAAAPSQQVAFEGWPTTLPTFTPIVVPSATALPTITPFPTAATIATPNVEETKEIAKRATMQVTLSTVQQANQKDAKDLGWIDKINGTNTVTVEYVATVTLGVDLNTSIFEYSNNSAIAKLSSIQIISIEPDWNQSRIVGVTNSLIGRSLGLETQAWTDAQTAIRAHVEEDSGLKKAAKQVTETQMEEEFRKRGYQTISVSFQQ